MNRYEDFVMRSVRDQQLPRTLDEAERNATYASPLWRDRSEVDDATQFIGDFMFYVVPLLAILGFMLYAVIHYVV